MRSVLPLASALAASVFLLSGCLSSSPQAKVWTPDATALRVQYVGGPDAVVDALRARGCVPVRADHVECSVVADGQSYTAIVGLGGLAAPLQLPSGDVGATALNETRQPTTEFGREDQPRTQVTTQNESLPSPLSIESAEASHRLQRESTAASRRAQAAGGLPMIRVRSTTRVVGGDGELVRLGGTDSEALRGALYALVVQDLEVRTAGYDLSER